VSNPSVNQGIHRRQQLTYLLALAALQLDELVKAVQHVLSGCPAV
jgi:hypothetical protein